MVAPSPTRIAPPHFPAPALDRTRKFNPLPRAAEMVSFYLGGRFLVRKTQATAVGSFGAKEREKGGWGEDSQSRRIHHNKKL